MKKRIGAFVLAGAMLLSMTGCGNSKANDYSKYVELGQYTGIEYTKTVAEVTEADVQAEIDSFLAGLTETEAVTDRAVEDGDIVNIDFVGTMDGVEFEGGNAKEYDLTIGSNSFIEGFEEGLIGHEIGDEVSLDLVFPDPYLQNPDLAGKDVTFAVTINSISVKNTPELTDALVKENTDYDTIDAYKESIEKNLQTTNESNAEAQAQSDIFNQAVKNAKVTGFDEDEVKKLVDDEYETFKQTAASYEAYGYSYEQVLASNGYENEDQLKEGITEYIKNYLTQKMVLYMIADKEGIEVTQEEIDAKVQETMAATGAQTAEELYDYYGDDYFELFIMSEKVMDFLKENAVLVDSIEETTEEATETATEEAAEATTEE